MIYGGLLSMRLPPCGDKLRSVGSIPALNLAHWPLFTAHCKKLSRIFPVWAEQVNSKAQRSPISDGNRKLKKPRWIEFVTLALLLVMSGSLVTACQLFQPEGESTQPQEKPRPVKVDQHNQSPEAEKTDRQNDRKPKDSGEDTQDDDDPE